MPRLGTISESLEGPMLVDIGPVLCVAIKENQIRVMSPNKIRVFPSRPDLSGTG